MGKMKTVTVDVTTRLTIKVPAGYDEESIQELVSELDVEVSDPSETSDILEAEIIESEVMGTDDDEDHLDDDDEEDYE